MAGALDSLFKSVAKDVVAELGTSLDTAITYTRKTSPTYNVDTGAVSTTNTVYTAIKVPIEYLIADEESNYQETIAKLYITPNLIGNNQPTLQDEISLTYAGATRTARIRDIKTYKGGQEYLYTITVIL